MARAFLARDDSDMPPRPRTATIIAVVTGSRARSGSPTIGRPRPEVQKERRTDCFDWRNRVGAREGGVALACIHLQLPPLMQNTLTGFPTEWQLPWRFPGPGLDTTWLSDDTTQWLVLETTAISRAHARAFFFFALPLSPAGFPPRSKCSTVPLYTYELQTCSVFACGCGALTVEHEAHKSRRAGALGASAGMQCSS